MEYRPASSRFESPSQKALRYVLSAYLLLLLPVPFTGPAFAQDKPTQDKPKTTPPLADPVPASPPNTGPTSGNAVPGTPVKEDSATAPRAAAPSALTAPFPKTAEGQPQELDKVIAIINGDVLLQSDVTEEMQFGAIQPLGRPGQPTDPAVAGRRLINRTLILQQMKLQQSEALISDDEVHKSLEELRRQIPACARMHCDTPQGWAEFLKENSLTQEQVEERWRQRLQIMDFIDQRFRNGVRITKPEIQSYYDKTFVPAFKEENANPPALPSISTRIEEILLQQRVTALLQEWLMNLRDQGSVQILDPIYGPNSPGTDDNGGEA